MYGIERKRTQSAALRDAGSALLPGTAATLSGSGADASAAVNAGNYGAAAGHVLRGAAALPLALADDVVGRPIRALAPVAAGVGNALTTAATGDNTPVFGARAPAAPPARVAGASAARPAGPYTPFEEGFPVAAPAPAAGARRAGPPLFGNAPASDNEALMARGAVSPQNMAAADNLAARYDGSATAQYNKEVEDAAATNMAGGFGTGRAETPRSLLMGSLSGKKLTAKGAGVIADIARTDAATASEAGRTKLAQDRLGLDSQRLGADLKPAGLDQATRKQLADAQSAYLAAKTPEAKAAAAETLRALQGKNELPNRFTVVPGGQELVDGQLVTRPASVINNQTGEFVNQGAAKPATPQFEAGKVYQDAKGNRAKWDGKQFVPA